MVNEWTRDDLPDPVVLAGLIEDMKGATFTQSAAIVDAVVEHLNANGGLPADARWRRAHSIVEQERDQARESLLEACKLAHSYRVDAYNATERAEAAERERDEVQERADQLRDERDDAVQSCITVGRARDKWKARAIEAEQAEDPIMVRIRELLDLAYPGDYAFTGAFETRRKIAEAEAKKARVRADARREGQAEAFDEGWKARAEREPRVMNIRGYSAPPPPHGLNPYRNGEGRHVDQ